MPMKAERNWVRRRRWGVRKALPVAQSQNQHYRLSVVKVGYGRGGGEVEKGVRRVCTERERLMIFWVRLSLTPIVVRILARKCLVRRI
jgi:hypothetical protein